MVLPLAAGDTRADYQHLASIYLVIAVVVAVLVLAAIVGFALRYRARASRPAPTSERDEAPVLEGAVVVGLILIAAVLVALTFHTETREDALAASPPVRVHAVAAQWRWRFDYPGGVSQLGTNAKPATLVVPRGQTVGFTLTSRDVIHAMWVPDLRFKKDAIPGRVNRFDMVFPQAGFFEGMGECSEFCGLYHAQMRFDVRVLAPAAYRAWLARRQGAAR
jgi:cytochrome c oxidase subunit II